MEIKGIPGELRDTDVLAALKSLGIEAEWLVSVEFLPGVAIITTHAVAADGKPFVARNGDHRDAATNRTTIKVVRGGD